MANGIYQKFYTTDNGPWVLKWSSGYQQEPKTASTLYAEYIFDGATGSFTLTGETFSALNQTQRFGYRLSGDVPCQVYTYPDNALNGNNMVWTGSIVRDADRPDRYQKAGLAGTVELPYGSVPDNGVSGGYWYVFQRMALPLSVRIGGVWRQGVSLQSRMSGVWRTEEGLSARISGIWR